METEKKQIAPQVRVNLIIKYCLIDNNHYFTKKTNRLSNNLSMTKIVTTQTVLTDKYIANKIHVFREVQVMTDRDLAEIYQVETRSINQAVKRNIDRFPDYYRFQLNNSEFENWKSQTVMSNEDKNGTEKSTLCFY